MITRTTELKKTLGKAVDLAKERKHKHITLEHLLLALLEDEDAKTALLACRASINDLHEKVKTYLDRNINNPQITYGGDEEPEPVSGYTRALTRADRLIQSKGGTEISGAVVLAGLLLERNSAAALFLDQQEVMYSDVVNFIVHGVSKFPLNAEKTMKSSAVNSGATPTKTRAKPTDQGLTLRSLFALRRRRSLRDSLLGHSSPRERLMNMRFARALHGNSLKQ